MDVVKDDAGIIIFPEVQKLKDEVEKLKTELSMLLLERDELKFVICKNIETMYMVKLGALEYKAYKAECTALRLKRKIELIQAKKNRREKIVPADIEEALDREFAEYQEKLNAQIDKMNSAIDRIKAGVLSEEENKELKRLYRKIVKTLHPDVNPGASKAEIRMFNNAVTAYENGDLETLRLIDAMTDSREIIEKEHNGADELLKERNRLKEMLDKVRKSIEKIKSEYPYTMKAVVEDPEELEMEKTVLEDVLKMYREMIEIYEKKLDEMMER